MEYEKAMPLSAVLLDTAFCSFHDLNINSEQDSFSFYHVDIKLHRQTYCIEEKFSAHKS